MSSPQPGSVDWDFRCKAVRRGSCIHVPYSIYGVSSSTGRLTRGARMVVAVAAMAAASALRANERRWLSSGQRL